MNKHARLMRINIGISPLITHIRTLLHIGMIMKKLRITKTLKISNSLISLVVNQNLEVLHLLVTMLCPPAWHQFN